VLRRRDCEGHARATSGLARSSAIAYGKNSMWENVTCGSPLARGPVVTLKFVSMRTYLGGDQVNLTKKSPCQYCLLFSVVCILHTQACIYVFLYTYVCVVALVTSFACVAVDGK